MPWVAWYEPNSHFGEPTNIFASRFNAGLNKWLPAGQDRTDGLRVPSLNIHTDRTAENPSVAGGATVAGNDPVPWIIWEENDGVVDDDSTRQIFVAKGVKQTAAGTPCTGLKPSDMADIYVDPVPSVERAALENVRAHGDNRVAVVPEGPYVIPVYRI